MARRGGGGGGETAMIPEGEGLIVVAIDKEKSSQSAIKWAVGNYIPRNSTITLIHVLQKPSSSPPPANILNNAAAEGNINGTLVEGEDSRARELFRPYRCYCTCKQIQTETVILKEQDVAKALINYINQNRVGSLILGASSKNSLTRLFKGEDIPSNIMRWAPDFCNVLVISKGKLTTVRAATCPVFPNASIDTPTPTAQLPTNDLNADGTASEMSIDREEDIFLDDISSDVVISRASTDSSFISFYENLGSGLSPHHNMSNDTVSFDSPPFALSREPTSSSYEIADGLEAEMRRLKKELKQTKEMYHAACKEALAAKQKVSDLDIWKKKAEQRLEEVKVAEEKAMTIVDREKAISKAANEKAEAAQKMLQIEMQKGMEAELKFLRAYEERNKMLDVSAKSHLVLKYRSLFPILAAMFLYYVYFSVVRL